MRIITMILLASFLCFPAVAQEKKEQQVVDVYVQKTDTRNGYRFFMFITGKNMESEIVNGSENVSSGYDFASNSVYLSSKSASNMMCFVHPYTKNKSSESAAVRIEFGGSRPDDINIYLPKDAVGKFRTNTIPYRQVKVEEDN